MPPFTQKVIQQPVRSSVQPSVYQRAIIDWLITGTGNAIVDAKAGSGKTSTLCMLADIIPNNNVTRAAFLAFNKAIATELQRRLPNHVQAATFHSVCMQALRRHPACAQYSNSRGWVQANKVHHILDGMVNEYGISTIEQVRKGVKQLVGLMKANAMLPDVDEDELNALVDQYEIDFDEGNSNARVVGMEVARKALAINNNTLDVIDFDDMLYLAWLMNAPIMKYSHLMVDEAQDTNLIQRLLIARMLGRGARAVFVGDEAQAIYAFRGADSSAMQRIEEEFNCARFPLSISYRCPRKVIALAQRIVPDIEARENAPEGTVKQLNEWAMADFSKLDLVVCRNSAPLVSLAYRFLRAHKPVKVMGREIGEQLVSLIQKMNATTLEDLDEKLASYTTREVAKALKARQEQKAERLQDQYDSILAIIDGLPETDRSIYAVIGVIRTIFDDKSEGCTTLATIHKIKGGEAHRVFILDKRLMPSKYAKQAWQQEQERNLFYVAVTRSLDTLYFVDSEVIQ